MWKGRTKGVLTKCHTFRYQTEPHKPWPALPDGPERFAYLEQQLLTGIEVISTARHSEHPGQQQALRGPGGRRQLWSKPESPEAWLEIRFTFEKLTTGDAITCWRSVANPV